MSPPDGLPPLVFRDVTFRRGTRTILDRVSLSVRAGETVALLGPSGAGKTTLFRLALGFLTADSGEVRINGRELSDLSERQLARVRERIGIVFQDGALFTSMTVFENVACGLPEGDFDDETIARRVLGTLATVGMDDLADRMPDELSGGQAQRVAVARAIVGEPAVMLYDEPTQGLDPRRAMEVVQQIRRLAGAGVAGLAVTHQLEYARHYADRVALLEDGHIRYDGPVEGLRTLDNTFVRSFFEVLDFTTPTPPAPAQETDTCDRRS